MPDEPKTAEDGWIEAFNRSGYGERLRMLRKRDAQAERRGAEKADSLLRRVIEDDESIRRETDDPMILDDIREYLAALPGDETP